MHFFTKQQKTENPPTLLSFSFPTRYTLVQQAGKKNILKTWNIYKNWTHLEIGRSEIGRIQRLVAFRDWSHFRKFGDWSFGEWSFGDWSFGEWLFGDW
jgi:hypothetical protein